MTRARSHRLPKWSRNSATRGDVSVVPRRSLRRVDKAFEARTQSKFLAARFTSCVANASNDATQEIQAALDAAATNKGGVVFLPTGLYCVAGHITVHGYTTLKGVWTAPPFNAPPSPPTLPSGSLDYGTTLLAVESQNNPNGAPFISLDGGGSAIEGLTVYYPNQTAPTTGTFAPKVYPYTIKANWGQAEIRNVMLFNPYQGVDFFSVPNSGRHVVDGLWGQPIATGIRVDQSTDVTRISNVHFAPFWATSAQQPVLDWIQTHGRRDRRQCGASVQYSGNSRR